MADVTVVRSDETDHGFVFDVVVAESGRRTRHRVTLDDRDYDSWAWGGASPSDVAERCMQLLVERVRHEDLMDRFDLREALQLYPAFEDELRRLE